MAAPLGEGSLRRFKPGAWRAGDDCDAAVAPEGAGQGALGRLQWTGVDQGWQGDVSQGATFGLPLSAALDIVQRCGEGRLLHQRRGERALARG